jgi:hypothetical protein
VQEFPMTVTGKLQKYRMREIAVEQMAAAGGGLGSCPPRLREKRPLVE